MVYFLMSVLGIIDPEETISFFDFIASPYGDQPTYMRAQKLIALKYDFL